MKTTNEYWVFLERLRRSGAVNMFGASPCLVYAFGIDEKEARKILADWMEHYNPEDYEEESMGGY